jgi:ubiquinol-cytochrome c reductase cytochrome b subunit
MKWLLDWLDDRTGICKITREGLYENIPGGSRWRYIWGSALSFCLVIQIITGVFLWMHYSPSAQSAWASVNAIQNDLAFGWLLRGIHHYTADVMMVLLVLHLMQVIIDGAYRAPREFNFWFGIGLLMLTLGLALTGYLLPWDQKGFWATKVATNIMAITPVVGPELQKLVVGGTEYGHYTLTRFFALHAGILPGLMICLVGIHIYLFRRHGVTPAQPIKKPDAKFWPDQVLKDGVASLAVLAAVLFLVIKGWVFHGDPLGAELTAPADLAEPYNAARPEWYFLFLFQLLKFPIFQGENEVYGAMVVPGATVLLVCLMPFLGRWRLGHWFNVGVMFSLITGVGLLTYLAVAEDRANDDVKHANEIAHADAARARVLAAGLGIPPEGAVMLMRNDPKTMGPRLFAQNCASCHRFDGHDGLGLEPADPQTAANLKGFASREWLAGLLDPAQIATTNYFGGTEFAEGKMVEFVHDDVAEFDDEEKEALRLTILALSAEANLPAQAELDLADAELIEAGKEHLADTVGCVDCHEYEIEDEDASAPLLTGYGSREWLVQMIANPEHPKFYGEKNDRMAPFLDDGILTEHEIGLVADWIRGDWYEPEPEEDAVEIAVAE